MTRDISVRTLSDQELDAISGGKTVVCVRTQSVEFMGIKINWATCENGQKIVYVTND